MLSTETAFLIIFIGPLLLNKKEVFSERLKILS